MVFLGQIMTLVVSGCAYWSDRRQGAADTELKILHL